MRSCFDKEKFKNSQSFKFEVSRNDILQQSVEKLIKIKPSKGFDPLKLPLQIVFEKEAGIDMGGVAKEYFKLICEQIFNPNMGMFKFNPDTNLYWFNGKTFESNLSFELVGMLMGIAFYNNYFIDMPIVPTCYKILLGLPLELKDLA